MKKIKFQNIIQEYIKKSQSKTDFLLWSFYFGAGGGGGGADPDFFFGVVIEELAFTTFGLFVPP